jgi:hypothetical protein
MRCLREEVERLDAALASLARGESALRLRLGQVLELASRGACFALGFSSAGAYALERCDRSVRWAEAARCLARRVEPLPELRRGLAEGTLSWSMGELLARVAQPEDEARWLESASSRTVRQMRGLVGEALSHARAARGVEQHAARREAAACANDGGSNGAAPSGNHDSEGSSHADAESMCTLSCSVTQEDAWLFEATRALLGQLGTHGTDAQLQALLAEAHGTLLAALPEGALDGEDWESGARAQQRWLEELARWRTEAERLCEPRIRSSRGEAGEPEPVPSPLALAAVRGMASLEHASHAELDAHVRGLARALARQELQLARLALRLHRADGWRRLGYASETQYARERLGMSNSSWLAKRALALRLEKLPRVSAALGWGRIGIEAATQLARVATSGTEAAWVERARQRTIKHLREEVAAALVALRLSGEADCPPPAAAELAAFHELEQAVVSGRACQARPEREPDVARAVADARRVDSARLAQHASAERSSTESMSPERSSAESMSPERRAWLVMLGSLAGWLESGLQMSAVPSAAVQSEPTSSLAPSSVLQMSALRSSAHPSSVPQFAPQMSAHHPQAPRSSAGKVQLRLRISRTTYTWWRGLEAQARRWLPRGMSWLRFVCLSLWHAWRHLLGADVAYGHIYIRDRFRCLSPVCNRRDVTPHHLRFRSAGGSDDPLNIGSFCCWCHLEGVHGGRIRALGTAEDIRWELGSIGNPCLVVQGRERLAA